MGRPSYQRVKQVVGEASKLAGDKRREYLDRACEDEAELRAEVQQLLRHGDADTNPLNAGVAPVSSERLAQVVEATTSSMIKGAPVLPERIGPFRVVRRIATGGMGTVYEAEQDNPSRRVALKILRRELLSPGLLKRFQQETQILGLLQHAGIAQIYEAGTTPTAEGPLPYFAMEFVDGRPLVAYADDEQLNEAARLKLFAKVCDAVQHAHEKGVIHRDLKPDNVLVTAEGQPKVLDFGVARATDADIQALTVVTEVGQMMGTLPYMSPEQVLADPAFVDARSDVYSLGVMLYEMLCGQRPHEFGGVSVPSAARIIREDTVTRLGSMDTSFRGDVETIVGMALEKDIRRRYTSVAELADDIRRHLANKPISAHAPSSFYQLSKFARRHRGLVGGTLLALVALTVGLGFAVRYGLDEAAQRRAAQAAGYRTALAVAALRIDSAHSNGVAEILDAVPLSLRGWEWEHLRSRTSRHLWEVDAYELSDTIANRYRFNGVPVVFSVDGARVISLLDERTLGVWDTETGALQQRIDVGAPIIQGGLAAGPGGVAALLVDDRLVVCDVRGGVITHSERLEFRPLAMSWDPHSGLLAVSCMDAPGRLLIGTPGDLALVPVTMPGRFERLTWTSGGRALLLDTTAAPSAGWKGGLVQLDTRTWEQLGTTMPMKDVQFAASVDPDIALVAVSEVLRDVRLLDIADGGLQERTVLRGHREPKVNSLAVSNDGRLVVSATREGTLIVWDASAGAMLEAHELDGVPQLAISPKGRFVAVNAGGKLRMLSPGLTSAQVLEGPGSYVYDVAWAADSRTLIARDFEANVLLYDALEGRPIAPVLELPRILWWQSRTWGLTTDGTRAVARTGAGGLLGLDLVSGNAAFTLQPDGSPPIDQLTLRRDFLRGTGLWDPDSDDVPGHDLLVARRDAAMLGYQMAPDGRMGLDIKLLRLEDAITGELVRQLTVLDSWDKTDKTSLIQAAFSPDGSRVAVARHRYSVLVYSCSTGELLAELTGHTSRLYCVAWSPDGARLASGGNDTTVRIWDAASYEPLLVLRGHDGYVRDVAWSPDGRSLASGSGDGTVRLWSTRSFANRLALIRTDREQRDEQRSWVSSLFEQLDDPHEVELAVRAAADLDDDQRHGALRVVRELSNAWWAGRVEAGGGEGGR